MKKLIPFMLALAFATVTMAPAFAQDPPKKEDPPKKTSKKKGKKTTEMPKKEGGR